MSFWLTNAQFQFIPIITDKIRKYPNPHSTVFFVTEGQRSPNPTFRPEIHVKKETFSSIAYFQLLMKKLHSYFAILRLVFFCSYLKTTLTRRKIQCRGRPIAKQQKADKKYNQILQPHSNLCPSPFFSSKSYIYLTALPWLFHSLPIFLLSLY